MNGPTSVVAVIDTALLTYTVEEVASMLRISRGAAYEHVRAGHIPAERLGRSWRIPRTRFHAWLDGKAAA